MQNKPLTLLTDMIEKKLNSPLTSSCGRLFDGISAILSLSPHNTMFEGQAASRLEAVARDRFSQTEKGYEAEVVDQDDLLRIKWTPLWHAVLVDLQQGKGADLIAARFHRGLVDTIAELAINLAGTHDLDTVCLGGGSFQNSLLLAGIQDNLSASGLTVLTPGSIPANDSGLSFGQELITATNSEQAS